MKRFFLTMVAILATSMISVAQSYNYGSNSRRSTIASTYGSYGKSKHDFRQRLHTQQRNLCERLHSYTT